MGLFDSFVEVNCCRCHIVIPMPPSQYKTLRETGDWFYCSNGHGQHFTKSENEKLKEQLANMTKYRDNALGERDDWKNRAEMAWKREGKLSRRIAALHGVITKMKKRRQ